MRTSLRLKPQRCWLLSLKRWSLILIFKSFWSTRKMFWRMAYSGEFHHSTVSFLSRSTSSSQPSPWRRWRHHWCRPDMGGTRHPGYVATWKITTCNIGWCSTMEARDSSFSFLTWHRSLCTLYAENNRDMIKRCISYWFTIIKKVFLSETVSYFSVPT